MCGEDSENRLKKIKRPATLNFQGGGTSMLPLTLPLLLPVWVAYTVSKNSGSLKLLKKRVECVSARLKYLI